MDVNPFNIDAETTARMLLGYLIVLIYLIFLILSALPLVPFGIFDFLKEMLTKKNCLICHRAVDFWIKFTDKIEFRLHPIVYKISVSDKLKMLRELAKNNEDE